MMTAGCWTEAVNIININIISINIISINITSINIIQIYIWIASMEALVVHSADLLKYITIILQFNIVVVVMALRKVIVLDY